MAQELKIGDSGYELVFMNLGDSSVLVFIICHFQEMSLQRVFLMTYVGARAYLPPWLRTPC